MNLQIDTLGIPATVGRFRPSSASKTLIRTLTVALISTSVFLSGCDSSPAPGNSNAAQPETSSNTSVASEPKERILTRLFWQDHDRAVLVSGELTKAGDKFDIQKSEVSGFPELNVDQNNLVQMVSVGGTLFVGVRDQADGKELSGWIEIDSGVSEESHGDHSHWHYDSKPSVRNQALDANQGNPAHVYQYGDCVYLANDKNNGFTMIRPLRTGVDSEDSKSTVSFFNGGGGHITLAAIGDQIAYSSWIDRQGENAGRIDVVDLRGDSNQPKYSFQLPSGGIHGATACGNRVFFAPSDGVCWVDCDFDFALDKGSVEVHHLPLGEPSSDAAYRTGAFETFQDHVLCIASNNIDPLHLCVINGTAPAPEVTRVPCGDIGGLRLSTVNAVSVGRKPHAFAFAEGDEGEERLLIFELDPDGDRDFTDAKQSGSIVVGKSKLDGHYGHHGIAFLPGGKTAVVSNPGDGTLQILDLQAYEIMQTISVGGQPTHIICIGR